MRMLRLVDPDPDCTTCDGSGQDVWFGTFSGDPYLDPCKCRVHYDEVE